MTQSQFSVSLVYLIDNGPCSTRQTSRCSE